jgi:hypothetical protein
VTTGDARNDQSSWTRGDLARKTTGRLVLAAILCAGCSDTTGVLLHIHGATPADQVSVTATTSFGTVTHALAAPTGPNWTLSFIATFRPEIGTVGFAAQPLVTGNPVGSCLSRMVAVPPHQVVPADILCNASGDGGAIGADYFQTVLADNPLAYYHLGESAAAGDTAVDATGNRQSGTYGPSVARHQPSPLTSGVAVADGAAGFPGGVATAAQSVRCSGTGLLPKTAISVELWLSSAGGNQGAVLVQYDFAGSGKVVPVYSLTLQQNHVTFVAHAGAGTTAGTLTSNATIAPNTPYHVVGTYDEATQSMSLFINGVLDHSAGGNMGDIIHGDAATSGLGIGGSHNDGGGFEAWNGILDEVAIYGVALGPDRVQAHYVSGEQP